MHADRSRGDPISGPSVPADGGNDHPSEVSRLRVELAEVRRENETRAETIRRLEGRLATFSEEAERELLRRTRELERLLGEQIQRLRDIDQLKADFLDAASHELRTPLTSIKGYAEFLEDQVGGPLTSEQRGYVAQIQVGTQRLQRIVDDMLDFARLEAGTFQIQPLRTDLGKLLVNEVASLSPQAREKQVALGTIVPSANDSRLAGNFDPMRVGQVILNLVGNAIKFTPKGGTVEVEARLAEGKLHVEVRDTGIGIPPDLIDRVFEKFFQVNPSSTREHGGVGLGLAISRALIEAHGGCLGVTSSLGNGSKFWFTLPAG